LKAGIMEIADIFVVNKADRDNAEAFYRNLRILVHEKAGMDTEEIPVFKTVATNNTGIPELAAAILAIAQPGADFTPRQLQLLSEKCWQIIQAKLTEGIDFNHLKHTLATSIGNNDFNLYEFSLNYLNVHRTGADASVQ
ncbi:MAG: hypothetical protein EBZ77_17220, partial [Chitinophagia bacterium]|nr:hypothetical protein [Chitinophagia bacterium]